MVHAHRARERRAEPGHLQRLEGHRRLRPPDGRGALDRGARRGHPRADAGGVERGRLHHQRPRPLLADLRHRPGGHRPRLPRGR